MQSKQINKHEILNFIQEETDIILPLSNGEPTVLLDLLEEEFKQLKGVKVHQILALKERNYMYGKYKEHLEHISYFLSPATRKAFQKGGCRFVPCHFHQMPTVLKQTTKKPLVMAVASPIDENGYFTLGTQADYVSSMIGNVPFILEVNKQMPQTFGENKIHINQVTAYIEVDYPLSELTPAPISELDKQVAGHMIEYIENGSTLQIGIGGIPNAVMSFLKQHRNLGVHTEMITDGIVELSKLGVIDGLNKNNYKGKIVGTFAYGTKNLYDFIHKNESIWLLGVDKTNDPRIIAQEDNIVSINATTEIDFYGQCASETIGGKLYSGTGGQVDFVTGSRFAKNGKSFICMPSTAKGGTISRIQPRLIPNSIVTTSKNDVDYVVTEFGIAELKYKSLDERAKELIRIAHPQFRDQLRFEAKQNGFIL
ncbi:propionyl-CoA--succinate CoA transferase [Bacillus sp. M6-12]|uniref:acetyl-CoA hydrolase/transferase family protein n=1 Tax=Bacillus sp. M6-12 TaxID=2054166 RepID=UPI000C775FFA|nr:acetyl-CoA hydrolase/transferase C-terminal domain-containing protein [Bacillus sp. M6-12]PLS15065.1 propionyl-CoA--succinate CoA transferase [Bacillus sp. M6-12]